MAIVKLRQPSGETATGRDLENGPDSLPAIMDELKRAGLYEAPVDIFALAARLKLPVRPEAMEDDMSGFLEGTGGRWRIGYNAYHNIVRQRFTVAHEIAHYVLHRSQQARFDDTTFARRSTTRDAMEREADEFAAALLMPADLVKQAVAANIKSLNELASKFRVSSLAMKFRLQKLGYGLK